MACERRGNPAINIALRFNAKRSGDVITILSV